MAEGADADERRRAWMIAAFIAVAAATALIGAYVYSLPSLGTAPLPTPAATATP